MSMKVIKPGVLTTLQDFGRYGWQAAGIPVGGAMDQKAAALVNIILGNQENEAVLEMTLIGPTIKFNEHAIIAIFGAHMSPTINNQPIDNGKPIQIKKGDILSFGHAKIGLRCYLGMKGGFNVPEILDSKSTNLQAEFGGFNGRKLAANDIISYSLSEEKPSFIWRLSPALKKYILSDHPIRFIEGRQFDWFANQSTEKFTESTFSIKPESNRMGYRLSGPTIQSIETKEMKTEGTTFGSIQIPPDGQPIILMADRQPTGGYPKIGEVISCDLPRLSQMRPGDKIRFEKISIQEAQSILLEEKRHFNIIKAACAWHWKDEINNEN